MKPLTSIHTFYTTQTPQQVLAKITSQHEWRTMDRNDVGFRYELHDGLHYLYPVISPMERGVRLKIQIQVEEHSQNQAKITCRFMLTDMMKNLMVAAVVMALSFFILTFFIPQLNSSDGGPLQFRYVSLVAMLLMLLFAYGSFSSGTQRYLSSLKRMF